MRSHGRNGVSSIRAGDQVRVIVGAHRVSAKVVQVRTKTRRVILDATHGANNRRLCIHVNNIVKI